MPTNHPYRNQDDRRYNGGSYTPNPDLNDAINDAVGLATGIGSSVLSSIAEALNSVGDPAARTGGGQTLPAFAKYRRRLDSRLSGSFGGWMTMGVFGWILCGSFGIAALVMAILAAAMGNYPEFYMVGSSAIFGILAPIFSACTLGFGVMGWAGCHKANYFGRLRKYLRVARGFTAPVQDLARDSMIKLGKAQKDLRAAVTAGHYPNAFLDEQNDTLYLDETLYTPPAPAPQPKAHPADAAPKTPAEQFRQTGVDFLNYLTSCRGHLGIDADAELDQMLKTCGAVVGFVNTHPEQLNRVRRFQEYYLPTTRKLLDTALGLDSIETTAAPETANAQAIRRDITGILHTLNIAYTKLYDTLLQDVSLDVSTEIDTLETMLRQDGLTHDFNSDFGAQPKP